MDLGAALGNGVGNLFSRLGTDVESGASRLYASITDDFLAFSFNLGNHINGIERTVATQFNAAHAYQRQIVPTLVWMPFYDPLILDLDGDGIETRGLDPLRPVFFDHNGDGVRTHTGWVAHDDGFLVLDRNGNGLIDDGSELFGDATPLAGRLACHTALPSRTTRRAAHRLDGIGSRFLAPPITNGKLIRIRAARTMATNAPSWPMAA